MNRDEVLKIVQEARKCREVPNLRGADLRYANLCEIDLRDADLRDANLRDAELRDANLRHAKGIHTLVHTQHGYTHVGVQCGSEWRVHGGCRDFSIAEARAHWNVDTYEYRPDAEKINLMLDWLEKQPLEAE